MARIMMRRVPRKLDRKMQHQVMKNWSAAIVERHIICCPKGVKIISVQRLINQEND